MLRLSASPCWALLPLFAMSCLHSVTAGEWQVNPEVGMRGTYSDNIALVSEAQGEQRRFVSEVIPAVEVLGTGNRLNVKGNYSLQSIYYGRKFTDNRNISQFLLNSDAEVIEDWLYLDIGAQQSQRLISAVKGITADNLAPNSGRGDVLTTTVSPRIKHSFGRALDLDAGYTESRVRYDASSLEDSLIKNNAVRLSRGLGITRLSWQLNYNDNKQWRGDTLSSQRKVGNGVVRYRAIDHVSVVANAGREVGQVVGGRQFQQGNYWSAGVLWTPTPRFSLELSSGKKDKQGTVSWAPTARTSMGVSYVDRSVGVRPSAAWRGFFNHRTRRTKWGLSYVKEISNDAKLEIVGQKEEFYVDELLDALRTRLVDDYGISNEEYTRTSSQADFSYTSKKNQIGVVLSKEQRDYETSTRQGETDGLVLTWGHNFTRRINSSLRYLLSDKTENTQGDTNSSVLSLGVNWEIGRRTLVGMEYRQAKLDSDDINRDYVENRLSANLKITL